MEDKYESLRKKLEETAEWPAVYMFKFILKSEPKQIALLESLFNTKEAEVTLRQSGKGNFVSFTAKEMMLNPEEIIARYKSAEGIEGLISL
jgi:putative lipoic acid-binding regulatory protein